VIVDNKGDRGITFRIVVFDVRYKGKRIKLNASNFQPFHIKAHDSIKERFVFESSIGIENKNLKGNLIMIHTHGEEKINCFSQYGKPQPPIYNGKLKTGYLSIDREFYFCVV